MKASISDSEKKSADKKGGFVQSAGFLVLSKILVLVNGLIVGVMVARYLGPVLQGRYSLAMSVVMPFTFVVGFGMDRLAIREIACSSEKTADYVATLFGFRSVLALLICIPVLLFSIFGTVVDRELWQLIAILLVGGSLQATGAANVFYQASANARWEAVGTVVMLSLSVLGTLIVVAMDGGLWWLVIVQAFSRLSVGLWNAAILRKIFALNLLRRVNFKLLRIWVRQGVPFVVAQLAFVLYTRTDQWMIKSMMGDEDVGYYAVPVRLIETILTVAIGVLGGVFPVMAKLHNLNFERYRSFLGRASALSTALGVVACIGIVSTAHFVIDLLFGAQYSQSVIVLQILAIGLVINMNALFRSSAIVLANLQSLLIYINLVALALNVVCNYFLIPQFGIRGAAFATVATQIIALLLSNLLISELRFMWRLQIHAFAPLRQFSTAKLIWRIIRMRQYRKMIG